MKKEITANEIVWHKAIAEADAADAFADNAVALLESTTTNEATLAAAITVAGAYAAYAAKVADVIAANSRVFKGDDTNLVDQNDSCPHCSESYSDYSDVDVFYSHNVRCNRCHKIYWIQPSK